MMKTYYNQMILVLIVSGIFMGTSLGCQKMSRSAHPNGLKDDCADLADVDQIKLRTLMVSYRPDGFEHHLLICNYRPNCFEKIRYLFLAYQYLDTIQTYTPVYSIDFYESSKPFDLSYRYTDDQVNEFEEFKSESVILRFSTHGLQSHDKFAITTVLSEESQMRMEERAKELRRIRAASVSGGSK